MLALGGYYQVKTLLKNQVKSNLFEISLQLQLFTITNILTITNIENQFVPCLWLLSLSGWYTNQYTHSTKLPPQSYYPGL